MPEGTTSDTTLLTNTVDSTSAPEKGTVTTTTTPPDNGGTTLLTEQGKEAGTPKGTTPQPLDLKPPVGVDPNDAGFLQFKQYAVEHNLTQAQAEKALDLYVKASVDSVAKKRAEFAEQKAQWAKQTQADPEIGGDRLPTSLALAKRTIQKFGSSGLTQILNESGLGNHPEIIRFLARTAKALAEDTFVGTITNRATQRPSEDEKLKRAYPSMFPKE